MSIKLQALDVRALFNETAVGSDAQASKLFADFAREQIAVADALNEKAAGRPVPYETFVDGRPSENLRSVRPNGVIVAEWELASDLVAWIYTALREKAPVLTGEYQKSITIFADGVAVSSPEQAAGAEEVVIMSTVPYARKLEGIPTPKYMSSRAPEGVFKAVYALARKRFSNQARIIYTFRSLNGGEITGWAKGRAGRRASKGAAAVQRRFERDVRNPAIVVRFR